MDFADRIRLEKKRSQLREQVTFKYVAAFLLRDKVISSEEFQLITQQNTRQTQMDTLIDLIMKKKSPIFENFLSALSEDHLWLAEDLKNLSVSNQEIENYKKENLENDFNQNHIDNNKSQVINMDVIKVLQRNARLVRRWSTLAYRLGLERQAQSIRVRVNVNCEDLDQCLFYLMDEWAASKPNEANLANLIKALKAEEFNDVAVQLESSC